MLRLLLLALLLALPLRAQAAPLGQWVWSRADLAPLAEARQVRSDIAAAVQVAELHFNGAQLRSSLRLSPLSAPSVSVVVVRFDDSFQRAFQLPFAQLVADTAGALSRILRLVKQSAPQVHTLQLDYDCPSQRLSAWAQLLRQLHERGVFAELQVWTTSLIAHLREPSFGQLFRGVIAGHVVQLFDTGELPSTQARNELSRLLARAKLPFCVGLGAFERAHHARPFTQHDAWWDEAQLLSKSDDFRGIWIFAAGKPWARSVERLP